MSWLIFNLYRLEDRLVRWLRKFRQDHLCSHPETHFIYSWAWHGRACSICHKTLWTKHWKDRT
jgi:hypothetical protein